MKLSRKNVQYLNNKHKGGVTNQKGNEYEVYFATFTIARMINKYPQDLNSTIVSSQSQSFVDDFFTLHTPSSSYEYFQLKAGSCPGWGSGFKSLSFEFSTQQKIENYNKRKFRLFLVVGEYAGYKKMNASIPRGIKRSTSVEYFPYYDSVSKYLFHCKEFHSQIASLCAVKGHDKLEALATCILGAWFVTNKRDIPLIQILNSLRGINATWIKSDITASYLSPQLVGILDQIADFTYQIQGGYFQWKYGNNDSGTLPHAIDSKEFRIIEAAIIQANPSTFTDLEVLMF